MSQTSEASVGPQADGEVRLSRRQFLGMAALTGAGLLGAGGIAASYPFEINRHHLTLAKLREPVRIAHLTDLHFGIYVQGNSLERWMEATMAETPDLIVITGDFIDTAITGGVSSLVAQVSRLHAPLGVWGVWGNHDYHNWYGPLERLDTELNKSGLRILKNDGAKLRDDLFLAGVDDLRFGQPNLAVALAQRPEQSACLLLSHNPDLLPDVPASVDLTLCGHTHGGQIRIPGVGPIATASRYGQRFVEGWISEPARAFVSRGLGMTLLPIRTFCPAELVILELEPPAAG